MNTISEFLRQKILIELNTTVGVFAEEQREMDEQQQRNCIAYENPFGPTHN